MKVLEKVLIETLCLRISKIIVRFLQIFYHFERDTTYTFSYSQDTLFKWELNQKPRRSRLYRYPITLKSLSKG